MASVPQDMAKQRNPGQSFNSHWFAKLSINRSAIERRCAGLTARLSVKQNYQVAWLLKSVSLLDLTTLSGDDTDARVWRLCAKAKQPISYALLQSLDAQDLKLTAAAVCVYHEMLAPAVAVLRGTGIHLAAVSAGFPAGLSPMSLRIKEIEYSVAAGADEIDIVISRRHVLNGDWQALYDEVRIFREICGEVHLKTILATGELGTLSNVAKASMVCMIAGADFIKTSTGKESINATLPVSLVMVRMIRQYFEATGFRVGFKPAGGISDSKTALVYLWLIREELGLQWLQPDLFRFGASSLLADIERQLDHHCRGYYSAAYRHPTG